MLILKLEQKFFQQNTHLVEVLDKDSRGIWDGEKKRGYGIVLISYNSLRFGIPLRTHISHKHCYRTIFEKGLDYTKAVLLVQDDYISNLPFMIDDAEYLKIKSHTHHISSQFEKFVGRYVAAVGKSDHNILREYKFSTLKNYHAELGLV